MDKREQLKLSLGKLSPQERQEYIKLNKIFSQPLTEASENSIKKGVQYLAKNWKNYSLAMLTALMLNPTMARAVNTYSPDTFNAIQTELTQGVGETSSSSKVIKSIDFSENFESGQSNLTGKETLQQKIKELQNWLKTNKKSNYKIRVVASESKVTNPQGYGKGELAQERASNVQTLLSKFGFKDVEVKTEIGTTEYKKGVDNPLDPKFKKEQSVRVEIYINSESICGFKKSEEEGTQGVKENNYITSTSELSGQGSVNFYTGTIPDRLVITDDNGNIKSDTGYITTKKSIYKEWKFVPLYVAQLTEIEKEGNEALSGSKIQKISASSLEELIGKISNQKYNYQKDNRQEVQVGLQKLQQLIDSGVTEFVIYTEKTTSITVPFNDSNGDSEVKVYSPLGQTGFTISGNCK